jgi:hypothetical protein
MFLLRIDSVEGHHFIQLQASGFNWLKTTPSLNNADVMPLQKVSEPEISSQSSGQFSEPMEPMKPMEPMEPMKPMNLGNMSMGVQPMEMRMGNMYMRMPEDSNRESSSNFERHFCTQCGNLVKTGDRFCAHCGHKLED